MMNKRADLKKSGRPEHKDKTALSEENGEFIDGCYYAPWDF